MRTGAVVGVAVAAGLLGLALWWPWAHRPAAMHGPGAMGGAGHPPAGHGPMGGPHHGMGPGASPSAPGAEEGDLVERGRKLFASNCSGCHGPRGRGGVPNPNSLTETVPRLDQLAERLGLFEPEDVDAVVALLKEGKDPASLKDDPPFPRYGLFLAQLEAVRELVRKGNAPGKKDPNGPEPPLRMPSWEGRLAPRDIDAIVAYLLTEYPWDEEE